MTDSVLQAKIESIRRCVGRIRGKTPEDAESFVGDYDLQDIICVNLERTVQSCVDLGSHVIAELDIAVPATMAETFVKLGEAGVLGNDLADRLRKAVGFRNISVHRYETIDWRIVYSIITERIGDFEAFTREILRWQERREQKREARE